MPPATGKSNGNFLANLRQFRRPNHTPVGDSWDEVIRQSRLQLPDLPPHEFPSDYDRIQKASVYLANIAYGRKDGDIRRKKMTATFIGKLWPKKKETNPYKGGESTRPANWPRHVSHKPPSDLKSSERLLMQLYGMSQLAENESWAAFHTISKIGSKDYVLFSESMKLLKDCKENNPLLIDELFSYELRNIKTETLRSLAPRRSNETVHGQPESAVPSSPNPPDYSTNDSTVDNSNDLQHNYTYGTVDISGFSSAHRTQNNSDQSLGLQSPLADTDATSESNIHNSVQHPVIDPHFPSVSISTSSSSPMLSRRSVESSDSSVANLRPVDPALGQQHFAHRSSSSIPRNAVTPAHPNLTAHQLSHPCSIRPVLRPNQRASAIQPLIEAPSSSSIASRNHAVSIQHWLPFASLPLHRPRQRFPSRGTHSFRPYTRPPRRRTSLVAELQRAFPVEFAEVRQRNIL